MYRRYTVEEVKRRIINVLQSDNTGLSGVELARKTGINRMTITKYLDLLHAIGLIKKKEIRLSKCVVTRARSSRFCISYGIS